MSAWRQKSLIIAFLFVNFLKSPVFCQGWPGFQADGQHGGDSGVDFPSKDIADLWQFKPSDRTWSYSPGSSVWSSSAVIAKAKQKAMVFVGFHNHNLYALDAQEGKIIWRFIAGGRLDSAPFFAEVNSRPVIYIVSGDRTAYALDASTGDKIWSYETLGWSYTIQESVTSSALVASIDGLNLLIFSIWNSDAAALNRFQRGELYALDASSGEKIYSITLSSGPLNSPAFSYIKGTPMIFVSSADGRAFGIDARQGRVLWQRTLCAGIYSSPSVSIKSDKAMVFLGSRFGNLYALDAKTGEVIWSKKFGYFIDSTPAITAIKGKTFIYFGSYDRNIYCLEAESGNLTWKFKTGNYVAASCGIARIKNSTVVFAHSLDNKLYCLDALSGSLLWSKDTGRLIWGYQTRGDTNWSSPAISKVQDMPVLVFPSYDGKLYAFSCAPETEEMPDGQHR